jgi:hypothetical protein
VWQCPRESNVLGRRIAISAASIEDVLALVLDMSLLRFRENGQKDRLFPKAACWWKETEVKSALKEWR